MHPAHIRVSCLSKTSDFPKLCSRRQSRSDYVFEEVEILVREVFGFENMTGFDPAASAVTANWLRAPSTA